MFASTVATPADILIAKSKGVIDVDAAAATICDIAFAVSNPI